MSELSIKQKINTSDVLAQVASRAKVSKGTVSRVFNNSALIPSETRCRVLSSARELGFRPRVGVRAPQIALVTEPPYKTIMGGYVNTVTQYICHALSRANAGITMITEDRIENLANCWFDGIIGIAWENKTIRLLKQLKNLPVVWLSDMYQDYFHTIFVDCREVGRIAGDYLIERGHHKIAVIHDPDYSGNEHADGVGDCMMARGVDISRNFVKLPNSMPLHLAVKQVIDAGCTAVWVTGVDMKVLEVNWLIQELAGKRIPEDISLMGFENPGISEFLRPSLTTVATPLLEMAEHAVELVLREEQHGLEKVQLKVKLIERNSVMYRKQQ
jgi:LacI family transcriptional regulator